MLLRDGWSFSAANGAEVGVDCCPNSSAAAECTAVDLPAVMLFTGYVSLTGFTSSECRPPARMLSVKKGVKFVIGPDRDGVVFGKSNGGNEAAAKPTGDTEAVGEAAGDIGALVGGTM